MYLCLFLSSPVFSYVLSLSNIISVLKKEVKQSSLHGVSNQASLTSRTHFVCEDQVFKLFCK